MPKDLSYFVSYARADQPQPRRLKPIPLDGSADLAGLEQLQVFRDREGRAFTRTSGSTADAFADQFVAAMLTKLRRLWPQAAP